MRKRIIDFLRNFVAPWLAARARERCTWAGLTAFMIAGGVTVSPEQADAIATVGGLIGTAFAVTKAS